MMNKIYYLANIPLPTKKAHGVHIMNMCSTFAKQGMEVELLIPRRFNKQKEDPFEFYNIERNFKLRKIFILDFIVFDWLLGQLAFWMEILSFYFSVLIYLFFRSRKSFLYTRDFLGNIFSLLGFRVIYECHNIPEKGEKLFFLFSKLANRIIVISSDLKQIFIEKGFDTSEILVAPDGVDLNKFDIKITKEEARKKLSISEKDTIIMYTGHLYKWKGAQTLAEAAKKMSGCGFYFVGGNEREISEFKEKNQEIIKNGRIHVIGYRPYWEIPVWLKAADVLVLPNSKEEKISRLYTSPLKLFEYMASGRPIVASDLPSIRNILNEDNCLFFKPDDSRDLARKIEVLLGNQKLASLIARQDYMDVQSYDWNKRAVKILDHLILKD